MRVPFRQGIIKHSTGGFLSYETFNRTWTLRVNDRPTTITLAHRGVNYLFEENNQITSAWEGPTGGFNIGTKYWLYWDFSLYDFARTFGYTDLEPIIQASEPGNSDTEIVEITESSSPNTASFTVEGKYVPTIGRKLVISNSPGSPNIDGTYTVIGSTYHSPQARTEIFVEEPIAIDTVQGSPNSGGIVSFDLDSAGLPLKTEGRMWYQVGTGNEIHWEYQSGNWVEVLRVFAGLVIGSSSYGMSSEVSSVFTGTQIGETVTVNAGRPIFTDVGIPAKYEDGRRFFTTESKFYTPQASVNNVRLESNVHYAQSAASSIAEFNVVAYDPTLNGKIRTATYDDIGTTVVGMMLENVLYNETGSVLLQGVVTNAGWDWSNYIGNPLWIDNSGILTLSDPHVSDPITYRTGRVPVARVLEPDTIIFEQGLGGKGDTGPRGSSAGVDPATTTEPGTVILSTNPLDPNLPCVVGCNDPILTSPKPPTPHSHNATEIVVDPTGLCFGSTNIQDVLGELCSLIPTTINADDVLFASNSCAPTATNVQDALDDLCAMIPAPITNLPYDISFFNQGPILTNDDILGAFLVPRDLEITSVANHIAVCGLSGPTSDTDLILEVLSAPYTGVPVQIGTVEFPIDLTGSPAGSAPKEGIVNIPSNVTINQGDYIRLKVDPIGDFDPALEGIAVTLIGCALVTSC